MPVNPIIVTAVISTVSGLLIAMAPKWLAAKLKKRENGALVQRNLELRQIEVEADARASLWENTQEEMERLRDQVGELRAEVDGLHETMRDVDIRVSQIHAELLKPEHSAAALARLAVDVLDRVRRRGVGVA